ncbi:MAG TPA: AMP-binding protein, partial [Dehalococcoidia bacterium]|nr:AMP-binding protein [Dehalococcoidia bacterium]
RHLLAASGARAALVAGDVLARVEAIRGELPELQLLHPLEEIEGLAAATPPEPRPVEIDPQRDMALLFASGGTTGLPKLIPLSHFNIVANLRQIAAAHSYMSLYVFLTSLPLYFSFGLTAQGFSGLFTGATQVIMPRFDSEEALHLIEKHRVTHAAMAPPALAALVEAARRSPRDTSSLLRLVVGGSLLKAELGDRATEVLPCHLAPSIGLSEANLINTTPARRLKPESVGPPLADTLEKVVDVDTGEEVGPGQKGELLLKGPSVFKGYWRNPEATQEAFTADGWFRTGDIVRADEEGYIYILDRKKDVIKYKGYSVTPAELEEVLREHPAVLDACVVPKQDPAVGEVPKAYIVLISGAQAGPDELMAYVEERVAPYKEVREVEFIEAIPRDPVGKIRRRELVDRERAIPPGGSPGPGRAG